MADNKAPTPKPQGMKTVWAPGPDQWIGISRLILFAVIFIIGGLVGALYHIGMLAVAVVGMACISIAALLYRKAGVVHVPAGCSGVVFTRNKSGELIGVTERLEEDCLYWRDPRQYRRVFFQGKKSKEIKVKDIKLHFGGDMNFAIAVLVTFECDEDAEQIIRNFKTRERLAKVGKSHKTALSEIVKKHAKRLIEEPRHGLAVLQEPMEGAKVLFAALKADQVFSQEIDEIDGVLSSFKFDIEEATAKAIFEKADFETIKTRTVGRAADRHLAAVEQLEDLIPALERITAADPMAIAKLEATAEQLKKTRKAGENVVHLVRPSAPGSGGGRGGRGRGRA